MQDEPRVCAHILESIRERSATGRLVRVEELLVEMQQQGLLGPEELEPETHWETALARVFHDNPDLQEIGGSNGSRYFYSAQTLSHTYAAILARKDESPLALIAEVVRENSRVYPRPVPLDSFLDPPFGLSSQEIGECLRTMSEQSQYHDIAQTVTSIGTRFLYSTRYLDRDHAVALAEWVDVGQVNNP
jgi:hypothetical protein